MSETKVAAVAVVALIIGLVIGLFIPFGQVAPANPVTTTCWSELPVSLTTTVTYGGPEHIQLTTTTVTVTEVSTATMASTMSITTQAKTTEAPRILLSFSGSGLASSPLFTATTSTVKVTLHITAEAEIEYVAVAWSIYEAGKVWAKDPSIAIGSVNREMGTFESYVYGLAVGKQYYVFLNVANSKCEIIISAN